MVKINPYLCGVDVQFTTENLQALTAAIATGAREVYYGDKRVVYRSLVEMLQLRDLMRQQLGLADANRGRRVGNFCTGL